MRVVVYASSSKTTPAAFLKAAGELGKILAEEGHICVNGGGNCGGMGALNEAFAENGGKVVTVIHRRWVVDGEEFEVANGETVVVGGDDLAERKRKLLEGADAVIALPGGLGTLDELFDCACQKQLGFIERLPVCVVNVEGYYDPIIDQLRAAREASLLHQEPTATVHAEPTAAKALAWCAAEAAAAAAATAPASSTATSPDGKSAIKIVKALAMLPIILLCYSWLFAKTVNLLMWVGGDTSDTPGTGDTYFHWSVEFFGLIALLLVACKHLK